MGNVVTNAGTLGAFIRCRTRCTVFWVIDESMFSGSTTIPSTHDGYVQIRSKNQSLISNAINVVKIFFLFSISNLPKLVAQELDFARCSEIPQLINKKFLIGGYRRAISRNEIE
jgi:hypothetical protein